MQQLKFPLRKINTMVIEWLSKTYGQIFNNILERGIDVMSI